MQDDIIDIYFVGKNEKEARQALPFDSEHSARDYALDQPEPVTIFEGQAVIDPAPLTPIETFGEPEQEEHWYVVTEFTRIKAPDQTEALARFHEQEAPVAATVIDNVNNGRISTFAALHEVTKRMESIHVAMTYEDVRDFIVNSLDDDGEDSPYHGFDPDELAEAAVQTGVWAKGLAYNDIIMETAWGVIEHAVDTAVRGLRNES